MKVLFLTSPAPLRAGFSTSEKRPPLGLGYVMAVLKQEGHIVYFSDEYLKPSRILDSDFLERKGIDFVGIYSNTICYQETLKLLEKLETKRKKTLWPGKIMIGGPHTSVGYKDIPGFVDFIVIGEGERAVLEIINGRIKDRVVHGEKIEDLDTLPMPAWEEFIHLPYDRSHRWHDVYPVYVMNTSRGCPFSCSFCSVKSIAGKTYRFQSAERIIDDVRHMMTYYGARCIYFREDHFTLNKERVTRFCELLLKKNIRIDWLCETRVDRLDDPGYQKLMADSGCRAFYIGVESGSPRMLELFKKGETVDQFIKAFDISKKVGIKTYASFIAGFPGETEEDARETDRLIKRIKPDFVGKNVFVGLPGSELYDYIKERGLYEYEDENRILYPIGFLENVKRFYGNNPYFYVYDRGKIRGRRDEDNTLRAASSTPPLLSVVMAVFNQQRFLPGSISSILTQSFKDFEFIIVDDGSTDESLRIIESYRDPRIKIIRSETNRGLAASLNRALEIARGRLIARMDADDISRRDRFQKQVEFLGKNPGYHLVGTWSKMIDAAGNETGEMKPPVSYVKIREAVSTRNPFVHSSTMFRKDAVFKTGLYDENFDYSQDYELWSRFLLFHKAKNLRTFLHYWRKHDAGSSVVDSEKQKLLGDAAVGRYVELFRILNSKESAPQRRAEEFVRRLIKRKDVLKKGEIVLLLCNYILGSTLALEKKGHYLGSLYGSFPGMVMNWFDSVLKDERLDESIRRWIRYRMAGILYDRKKFEESRELCLSILNEKEKKFVNPGEIYYYLGNIYKSENNGEWKTYLGKWVEYSRDKGRKSTTEIYRLGFTLLQLGRLEESANRFKRVLRKKDVHGDMIICTHIYLGDIYYQLENGRYHIHYKEALKLLKSKKKKSDLDVYRTASLYKRLREWARAARWFNRLLDKPKSGLIAGAYFHLAEIAFAREDEAAGREYLEKCLSLDPGHGKAKEYITPLPPVSVIIPTYNRPGLLKEAIGSVLDQEYTGFEVIVVNDAGADVGDVIDSFNDKRIRYLTHPENRGLGAARNTGIKSAKGKYIALLDDDDIYYPNHLREMVGALENSGFKVVYSDALRALQRKMDGGYKTVYKQVTIDSEPFISTAFSRVELLTRSIGSSCSFMFEKDCTRVAGGFDETLTTHEDLDFWRRLGLKFPFFHINAVTAEVRSRYDGTTMSSYRAGEMERNPAAVFERYKKHLIKEINRKGEKSVSDLYFSGRALYKMRRFKESQRFFQKVLARVGASPLCRAGAHLYVGTVKRAIKEGNWQIHYREGVDLLKKKKAKTIVDMFRLGSSYYFLGEYEKSKKWLEKVVQIGVFHPHTVAEVFFFMGDMARGNGGEDWKQWYEKGIARYKETPAKTVKEIFQLSKMLYELGDWDESRSRLKQIHRSRDISPDIHARAYLLSGDIAKKQGGKNWKECYRKAIDLFSRQRNKSHRDVYRIASLYKQIQRFEDSERWFKKLVKRREELEDELASGVYFHLGDIYFREKREKGKAKRCFLKTLELNPRHRKAGEYLAEIEELSHE